MNDIVMRRVSHCENEVKTCNTGKPKIESNIESHD